MESEAFFGFSSYHVLMAATVAVSLAHENARKESEASAGANEVISTIGGCVRQRRAPRPTQFNPI